MFAKRIANIIIAVALISVFIGVFFFTYAAKIEQKIVVERSAQIAYDLTSTMKETMSARDKELINEQITPFLVIPQSLEQQDKIVQENNKELLNSAIKAIVIFVVLCALVLAALCMFYKIPLFDLIKDNLIILVFVALTEFIFLTFFAQNYITIDSNFVKEKISDSLINFASSQ